MHPADEQSTAILQAFRLPGFENPSAAEIIVWSKATSFGIPTPTREAAREEAARILAR
jgi:hypothetical protein